MEDLEPMSDRYILRGQTPVKETNLQAWAQCFDSADRIVRKTEIPGPLKISVSTVFLGLDHNYGPPEDGPILFETMVFGGCLHDTQHRYRTWEEAVAGHKKMAQKALHHAKARHLALAGSDGLPGAEDLK